MTSYLDDLNKLYVENVNINNTVEHRTSFLTAPKDYREDAEEVSKHPNIELMKKEVLLRYPSANQKLKKAKYS